MSSSFTRRSFLRGMISGATVSVGIPILDRYSMATALRSRTERNCQSGSALIFGGLA